MKSSVIVQHSDPQCSAEPDVLSAHLRSARERLAQRLREGAGGLETARSYSDLVDDVIRRMIGISCERAGRGATPDSVPIAIIATGGYGRRELCPYSDIDVTFVPHRDGDPLVDRIIKEMFTLVMRVFIDSAGLDVGYAYRLLEDCASLDHQTTSGLLDARLIAGSDRLMIQLEHDYWSLFNPSDFVFTKLSERRCQLEKAGETPRVVEPNLKEGAGGLRDLQTAVWMVQALHSHTAARVRGDRAWQVLKNDGGISEAEAEALAAAKEFLFRARNALHVLTGAERDQLVVTRQEEVAGLLGYTGPGSLTPSLNRQISHSHAPPVEQFMRDYYRHASAIHRITGNIIRRAENSRLFLGIGLDCFRREVVPANLSLIAEDPVWMLWACELAQKYGLEFSDELERDIVELLNASPVVGDKQQAAEVFTRILADSQGAYSILQKMADLGILGWLIPEVGEIMDLIPYDPSHDYTVGQHTLQVIRYLDTLRRQDGPEETVDLRRLMVDLPNPEQLYLAALLHDAGKTEEERPHSEVGEDLARGVCARLFWSEHATENIAFLVRQHLVMAETSRLRDLHLDETIREFTAIVDDLDRLNMLYLLTYSDTNAVGEGVWTQVKGRFLRDLYRRAERALAGSEGEDLDDADLTRTRRRLMKELSVENIPDEEIAEHVERMPAPYILNTSLNEIALHIAFIRKAGRGEPVVEFHDERNSTFTEVTVCTRDDPEPGLLAKIAGVFYAADTDVHSAQVFTRTGEHPIAIDTLYVDFRGRQLTPGKRKELATNLKAVLKAETAVEEVLSKRKKSPEIGGPIEHLRLRNDISEIFTVVEVSSHDERAMLYRASGALSKLGWGIHSARVSLFKGRSIASFYVTGAKTLSEADARRALLRLMPMSNGG